MNNKTPGRYFDPNDFEDRPQTAAAAPRAQTEDRGAPRYPARTEGPARAPYDAHEGAEPKYGNRGSGEYRGGPKREFAPSHGFVREYPSKSGKGTYLFITFSEEAPAELQKYVMNVNFNQTPKGNLVGTIKISESKPRTR